ncbi:uncharacterized protein LAESUDRAFT_762494, partial [Laetiporus sulphureus 93-53]
MPVLTRVYPSFQPAYPTPVPSRDGHSDVYRQNQHGLVDAARSSSSRKLTKASENAVTKKSRSVSLFVVPSCVRWSGEPDEVLGVDLVPVREGGELARSVQPTQDYNPQAAAPTDSASPSSPPSFPSRRLTSPSSSRAQPSPSVTSPPPDARYADRDVREGSRRRSRQATSPPPPVSSSARLARATSHEYVGGQQYAGERPVHRVSVRAGVVRAASARVPMGESAVVEYATRHTTRAGSSARVPVEDARVTSTRVRGRDRERERALPPPPVTETTSPSNPSHIHGQTQSQWPSRIPHQQPAHISYQQPAHIYQQQATSPPVARSTSTASGSVASPRTPVHRKLPPSIDSLKSSASASANVVPSRTHSRTQSLDQAGSGTNVQTMSRSRTQSFEQNRLPGESQVQAGMAAQVFASEQQVQGKQEEEERPPPPPPKPESIPKFAVPKTRSEPARTAADAQFPFAVPKAQSESAWTGMEVRREDKRPRTRSDGRAPGMPAVERVRTRSDVRSSGVPQVERVRTYSDAKPPTAERDVRQMEQQPVQSPRQAWFEQNAQQELRDAYDPSGYTQEHPVKGRPRIFVAMAASTSAEETESPETAHPNSAQQVGTPLVKGRPLIFAAMAASAEEDGVRSAERGMAEEGTYGQYSQLLDGHGYAQTYGYSSQYSHDAVAEAGSRGREDGPKSKQGSMRSQSLPPPGTLDTTEFGEYEQRGRVPERSGSRSKLSKFRG